MNTRTSDRIFAALGIGFVVLTLAGNGFAGDVHAIGLSDTTAKIAAHIGRPVPTHTWIGGYLEMLGTGCFLGFAGWAAAKLGGGVLGQLVRTIAAAYAAVIVACLGMMYGIGRAYGHGISVPVARAFDAVTTGVYVGSWFLSAFFLLAIGTLAVGTARRRLGWSAIGAGVVTLVATPSNDNFGQLAVFLFFVWVVGASIALVRDGGSRAVAPAVAQHA